MCLENAPRASHNHQTEKIAPLFLLVHTRTSRESFLRDVIAPPPGVLRGTGTHHPPVGLLARGSSLHNLGTPEGNKLIQSVVARTAGICQPGNNAAEPQAFVLPPHSGGNNGRNRFASRMMRCPFVVWSCRYAHV